MVKYTFFRIFVCFQCVKKEKQKEIQRLGRFRRDDLGVFLRRNVFDFSKLTPHKTVNLEIANKLMLMLLLRTL